MACVGSLTGLDKIITFVSLHGTEGDCIFAFIYRILKKPHIFLRSTSVCGVIN